MVFRWIIFFVCVCLKAVPAMKELHIGGLFEDVEGEGARSFLSAVKHVNTKRLLDGTRMIPHIKQVSAYDSFQVGKTVCELFETGVIGILGPSSSVTSYHVQSLCDTFEVPHLTTRWDMSQRRSSCLLNLYPHSSVLSQAITDIVVAWDWKGFTILYDDYEALMKIQDLVKLADHKGYLVTVRQLVAHPYYGYRPLLKEVKFSDETNIVLECSKDILFDVMLQAQQVGLMGSEYSYIITSLDFDTIDYRPFLWSETNITTLRLINLKDPHVQSVSKYWAEVNLNYGEEELEDMDYLDEDEDGEEGKEDQFMERDDDNGLTAESTTLSPNTKEEYQQVPSVEAALTHDAVLLFTKALQELDIEPIKPIGCHLNSSLEFGYTIINFMKLSEFEGMTGLVKFDHEGFRTDIHLDILEMNEEGLKKRGHWNRTLNMIHPEPEGPYMDHVEDLRNITFTVLIALTHPYNMLKEDSKALKGNDRYEGFGVDLIHELSLMSGFNYTFKEHFDKNSGNPTVLPNGTRVWNGMIGEVLAGRADLAIADITITREREMDADFTHPFMNLGISILHRNPTKAAPSLFSFLSPFSSEVWAYMFSAYVGVSLLLFVMARISPYEWTNPYPCIDEPDALENQFSLNNSFWFTVGSLMQQGSDVAPIAVSTRMVASVWWFFTLIMVSSYTAQLASFLTIETIVQPFQDIQELADQNIIKYGAKKNGSTANFFRDSKDPVHQKVYKFMEENPDCMMDSNEKGVERVLSEKNYAFFMESTSILYEVERKCDLAQVGGLLDNKGYGIVMKQNASFRNVLSKNVVKLQEKGKLTQLMDKWWKEKRGGGACSRDNQQGDASELSLDNTGGVFFVLLTGCVFSVVIAFCEILWDIYKREDKVSFRDELREEFKFIMKCRGTVKPMRKKSQSYSDCNDKGCNESITKSSSFF